MGGSLSLGLLIGFSGVPEPLKNIEVEQCSLMGFHLVGSRIFILELCAHGIGTGMCCQLLPF